MKAHDPSILLATAGWRSRVSDAALLTKAGLTVLAVCCAAAGAYVAARGGYSGLVVLHVVIGTYLLGSGAAVLNQYVERSRDVLMTRTSNRPLPAGRIHPDLALVAGLLLTICGILYLAFSTNLLAAILGLGTVGIYAAIYTPLKLRTHMATLVGAVPGSLPPLIGWAAVRGEVTIEAYLLFVIMFFWQVPHFLSLGWIYRDQYRKGGYKLLPVLDATGSATGRLALIYSLCLIPAIILLPLLGLMHSSGMLLLLPASGFYAVRARKFERARNLECAQRLFAASLVFLPILLTVLVLSAWLM
jgi:heme o synthase